MRAAFAYHLNAASPNVQSGRPHSILLQLRERGVEVDEIFPLDEVDRTRRKLTKIWSHLRGQRYLADRDERLLRSFAQQLQDGLVGSTADFLFSPSTLPLSYLETDLPISFCADAPFSAMVDYYASFSHLGREQLKMAETLEANVLQRAALAVYPTQWAGQQAIKHYGIDPKRVAIIPFGANFGRTNRREDVMKWIDARATIRPVRLLFVGSEWERKGGDLVVQTADWLKDRGVDVCVDLVGSGIPTQFRHRSYLHSHGRLSPHLPEQRAQLIRLFQDTHFVFVPSRAEAYGMTFCEANAFGLPALTTATGGITEIIQNGVNGIALPLAAGPDCFGAWIQEAISTPERYKALAKTSFSQFEERLNWNTYCREFLDRITHVLRAETLPKVGDPAISLTTGEEAAASTGAALAVDLPAGARVAAIFPEPRAELHVAFVADEYTDPTKVSSWSGSPHFTMRSLELEGIRFSVIHLDDKVARIQRWAKFVIYRIFRRKRYLRDRHSGLLRSYGREIKAKLDVLKPDLVFCMGTAPISGLDTDIPIVFWVDGTFAGMADFYRSFTTLARVSLKEGSRSDQAALSRAAAAIYSSDWAAKSAIQHYHVDPKRVHFVNFGANLQVDPTEEEIATAVRLRDRTTCRLLFIGVEWERKGANMAIAALEALRKHGVEATLTIIGCQPPKEVTVPPFVEIVGFVSKRTPEGNALIEKYFRESHFFILPTRAEAYGLVFCEASAFGLPSLAPGVGGIPSIIQEGVNGWLLPVEATPEDYAQRILGKWHDREAYEVMANNCHRIFRDRLNWKAAATSVAEIMRNCVTEAKTKARRGAQ